ncbi:MAG TPA: hypothetical protein PLK67_07590, partial [Bryobacteraceae bacterium]|nr:hypothetical protein [Bryobacteraceae bacterium]
GALADFQAAANVPDNLPLEGMSGGREAEIAYWTGVAYAGLGDQAQARQAWEKAAGQQTMAPRSRRARGRGVSPMTVQLYYRALAMQKLGRTEEAAAAFKNLIEIAQGAIKENGSAPDPGASFREHQNYRSAAATAHYVAALGHLGLNDRDKARQQLAQALRFRPDHPFAKATLAELN